MRVLITGATGLIGCELSKKLVESGHEIIAVSRDPKSSKLACPFPATHLGWDELKTKDAPSVDAVIHLAGEPIAAGIWTAKQKQKIVESRVETARNLQNAFRKNGVWPKTWITASAIGFYGDRGDDILVEDSERGSGFLAETCAQWEDASTHDAIPKDTRIVKVRVGLVLSPRGGMLATILPVFRSGLGGVLGRGRQWMSWIHLEDVVRIFAFVLEHESAVGVYNAVAPEPVTNGRFTKDLGRALKRPTLFGVPKFVLSLGGEMASLVLASQRVTSGKIVKAGFKFTHKTLDQALDAIVDYQRTWGVHEMFQEQWVPHKVEQLFPFFSDETNLEILTPPLLNFKVLKKSTDAITEGTLIDYRLKIRGFPAKWRTKILDWKPGEKFVDTQLSGPYKLWHHTHEFLELGGGTLMRDRVLYKLPFWPFGMVAFPMVKADVGNIFKFRRQEIARRFA